MLKKILFGIIAITAPVFVLAFVCQWSNGDIATGQAFTRSAVAVLVEIFALAITNR